jgi:hypothetical protein
MPLRDVIHLIIKPFLGNKRGPTKNEVLSRAVEHPAMKDAAAALTTLPEVPFENVVLNNDPPKSAHAH